MHKPEHPEADHPVISGHIDALNRGDLQQILETFTHDAEFTSPAGKATGTGELADLLGPTLVGPRARMQVLSIRPISSADGDRVVAHVRRIVRLADGDQVIANHEVDLVLTFTLDGELISRCHTELLDPGR
ncbi:nuclear transport factor 2 family protein [Stomatohabitans albus]|uniref:nuclear transport factor 2 family protein n=1 Tax=Stomatohabitans albus TaxID=3110766 RepID=UPI00300C312F